MTNARKEAAALRPFLEEGNDDKNDPNPPAAIPIGTSETSSVEQEEDPCTNWNNDTGDEKERALLEARLQEESCVRALESLRDQQGAVEAELESHHLQIQTQTKLLSELQAKRLDALRSNAVSQKLEAQLLEHLAKCQDRLSKKLRSSLHPPPQMSVDPTLQYTDTATNTTLLEQISQTIDSTDDETPNESDNDFIEERLSVQQDSTLEELPKELENKASPHNDEQLEDISTKIAREGTSSAAIPNIYEDPWWLLQKSNGRDEERLICRWPCLSSTRLLERMVQIAIRETLALDIVEKTQPLSRRHNHRKASTWGTCLDLVTMMKTTTDTSLVAAVTIMEDEKKRIVDDPNSSETGISKELRLGKPRLDPHTMICPYEFSGVCADEFCPYQHIVVTQQTVERAIRELRPLPPFHSLPPSPNVLSKSQPKNINENPSLQNDYEQMLEPSPAETVPINKSGGDGDFSNETNIHLTVPEEQGDTSSIVNDATDFAELDYLPLPPPISSSPMDGYEEDASDTLSGRQEEVLQPFGWLRNESLVQDSDVPRGGISLPDWLYFYGGFSISEDSLNLSCEIPHSALDTIAFVAKIVDVMALCLHGGRVDLALALVSLGNITIAKFQEQNPLHDILQHALSHTHSIIQEPLLLDDSSSDASNGGPLLSIFERQLSLLQLSVVLQSFHKQYTGDDFDCNWEELINDYPHSLSRSVVPSAEKKLKSPGNTPQLLMFTVLTESMPISVNLERADEPRISSIPMAPRSFTSDDSKEPMSQQPAQQLLRCIQGGKTISQIIVTSQYNAHALIEKFLEPIWQHTLKFLHSPSKCLVDPTLLGISLICPVLFTAVSCTIRNITHLALQRGIKEHPSGDSTFLDSQDYAHLNAIDVLVHKITQQLRGFQTKCGFSTNWMDLLLAPLDGLCVSISMCMGLASKAQTRLENSFTRERKAATGFMIYSELLWSQLIQLRMSFPTALTQTAMDESEAAKDAKQRDNPSNIWKRDRDEKPEQFADTDYWNNTVMVCERCIEYGLNPCHVSLAGDRNLFYPTNQVSRDTISGKLVDFVDVQTHCCTTLQSIARKIFNFSRTNAFEMIHATKKRKHDSTEIVLNNVPFKSSTDIW
eukprot:CAMPEP_0198282316 /NCGR_PEP_ID=MMETSP1449-20131203/2159_1 /TAXON_ID=420275 /ORGANISM="Attheya septentrionalis, Strain CCMP2084" /LENGTH=1111 /DNA_ID=CAMNT_0043978531 /DNA_START=84 /DNA_END=3416 /DNA_ORIENTATION=-